MANPNKFSLPIDGDGLEDYKISEGSDPIINDKQGKAGANEEIDLDKTLISLTDGRSSKSKNEVTIERIDESDPNEPELKSQNDKAAGPREVKYRETVRNREERMKKKGQE